MSIRKKNLTGRYAYVITMLNIICTQMETQAFPVRLIPSAHIMTNGIAHRCYPILFKYIFSYAMKNKLLFTTVNPYRLCRESQKPLWSNTPGCTVVSSINAISLFIRSSYFSSLGNKWAFRQNLFHHLINQNRIIFHRQFFMLNCTVSSLLV